MRSRDVEGCGGMTAFAMAMLVCSDLTRSRSFYRDILALRIGTDAFPDWVDFELTGNQRLGLHPSSETLLVRPGTLQLAFNVDNVDTFITDARTAGARVLQDPYDQGSGRVAVIADPDGYVIQVFSPTHAGAARY